MRKRCPRRGWVAAPLLVWVLLGATFDAQESGSLAGHMDSIAKRDGFSGVVLITRQETRLLAKGYGFANAEHGIANTPRTKFRIGSMTKPFTATAIMMLQEEGKLHVSDGLAKHFGDVPAAWRSITVAQLLSHTSGIVHTLEPPAAREAFLARMSAWHLTQATSSLTFQELAAIYGGHPVVGPPGAQYHYSGPGYFLLACIIEKVSGQTFEEFLRRRMFEPLGMKDTGNERPERILPDRASGYVRTNGELRNAPPEYMPFRTGGGDLYSTAEDLARWDRALRAGRLVSADSQEAMYTPNRNGYGYGWNVQGERGTRVVRHGGAITGFRSAMIRDLGTGLSVFVLANTGDAAAPKIAEELLRAARDAR